MADMVNHPPHYKSKTGLEAIDVIESFELGYHLGCATKYILRAGKKDDALLDLKKARWYLERRISQLEEETKPEQAWERIERVKNEGLLREAAGKEDESYRKPGN